MTSADPNDLAPAQEKLEWVTPKISLMVAEDTEGTGKGAATKESGSNTQSKATVGPS